MTKMKQKAVNILKEIPETEMESVLLYLQFVYSYGQDSVKFSLKEKSRIKKIKCEMDKGKYFILDLI
jgi:hypothetical protein